MPVYNYAIRFSTGMYYTGRSGAEYNGPRHQAYTFTEAGAYAKIERMDWHDATVERVL